MTFGPFYFLSRNKGGFEGTFFLRYNRSTKKQLDIYNVHDVVMGDDKSLTKSAIFRYSKVCIRKINVKDHEQLNSKIIH